MSKGQTDNSFFKIKVDLRIKHLPDKQELNVLDCFSADGKIWNEVKNQTDKNIRILRMEKEKDKQGFYLKGDNLKFLKILDLSNFDIIDLDAYGIPFKQLEILFNKNLKSKIIFITFIQSQYGCLPYEMLYQLGYTKKMIDKCPTLFYNKGIEKFKNYLFKKGVNYMIYYNVMNKYYICISC